MIASLPMYDPPHLGWANDALWQAIRAALPFSTPASLTRDGHLWDHWESSDLFLSQTCGLPYRAKLRGRVHLVATPDYGLAGCPPGHYHSTIVTRAGEDPDACGILAVNDPLSQSGWAAAQGLNFRATLETGAHAASLDAVREGRADIAVIDSHTLSLLGVPEGITTHGTTAPTPGLPFITARAEWVTLLREALKTVHEDAHEACVALGIRAFAQIDAASYRAVPIPPAPEPA